MGASPHMNVFFIAASLFNVCMSLFTYIIFLSKEDKNIIVETMGWSQATTVKSEKLQLYEAKPHNDISCIT